MANRVRERQLLDSEVERRLHLPVDQWMPVGALDEVTKVARIHLRKLTEPKPQVLRR